MPKTIFITGTSSGIGKKTALFFAEKGWNVAATMRDPSKDTELHQLPNVRLYALDVTDETSIQKAIELALKDFGTIDVVVNNAGYGAVGIFEKATPQEIRKQFETNVFGVMNVTRAILPHFRKKKSGTIINVTSMGGRVTFPLYSLYHATKWAIEGWAESLAFELRPLNIRIKNVEPGAIKTDFYDRSMNLFKKEGLPEYDEYEKMTWAITQNFGKNAPGPEVVANTIYRATNDRSFKLRYPASFQSSMLLFMRWLLPLSWFMGLVRKVVEKKPKP